MNFLFLSFCSADFGRTTQISLQPTLRFSLKNEILNLFLKLVHSKSGQWVNTENFLDISRDLNVDVDSDRVTCRSGPFYTPVQIQDKQIVFSDYNYDVYQIAVAAGNIEGSTYTTHYLPLTEMKNAENGMNHMKGSLLPLGFTGYLVCVSQGSEAVLVPKGSYDVNFLPPSWSVRVKLEMFRDPSAPYGRVYRVTILDNITVLRNNSEQFFFTLHKHSFASVFYLSFAISEYGVGKFCILSSSLTDPQIKLDCENWKMNVGHTIRKFVLPSFLIGGFFHILYNRSMPSERLNIVKVQKRSPNIEFADYLVEYQDDNLFNEILFPYDKMIEKKEHFFKKLNSRVFKTGSVIVLLILIQKFLLYNKDIIRGLTLMKNQFKEAPFVYPWSLSRAYSNIN